jgi:3-deoxy-D-manno-octulosonic-acid transferase
MYSRRIIKKRKSAETLRAMLGRKLRGQKSPYAAKLRVIWVHAVSVGEVVAAKALMAELKRTFPQATLVASTITETGQEKARTLLSEADEIFFFPLDLSWIVKRFLRFYNPWVYISMETELWPNLFVEARRRGTAIFLANGKLSPRSFGLYSQFSFVFRKPLGGVRAFLMQTEKDAERMRSLCKAAEKVFVTGNCKFDSPGEALAGEEKERLLGQFGLPNGAPIIVAGSTHSKEEELMLRSFGAVRKEVPRAKLIIAPRHPERFDEVWELLRGSGYRAVRATEGAVGGEAAARRDYSPDIVLLDSVGQLARVYGLGSVAVVCGSFAPIGGHNLLEAAVHSIPVIFGQYMQRQSELRELFLKGGGGLEVSDVQLAPTLIDLLKDEGRSRAVGEKARETVERNRGSARRTVDIIKRFLT